MPYRTIALCILGLSAFLCVWVFGWWHQTFEGARIDNPTRCLFFSDQTCFAQAVIQTHIKQLLLVYNPIWLWFSCFAFVSSLFVALRPRKTQQRWRFLNACRWSLVTLFVLGFGAATYWPSAPPHLSTNQQSQPISPASLARQIEETNGRAEEAKRRTEELLRTPMPALGK